MEIPTALFEPGLEIRLRHGSNGGFCDEAFEEFCRANPDLCVERNAQGEIIVTPPAGGESSHRNATLTEQPNAMGGQGRSGSGVRFQRGVPPARRLHTFARRLPENAREMKARASGESNNSDKDSRKSCRDQSVTAPCALASGIWNRTLANPQQGPVKRHDEQEQKRVHQAHDQPEPQNVLRAEVAVGIADN